ncbi:uncharacterized protein LOC110822556 isoform X2 [Carica papaya]|uniref:uncharacterized protein LOC110822556 isoform X2 n=1 Tax=Carica papaya TaxID=3649 RepID=UPI000B8CBBFC|nr:uncharacterized protein LOC110822556 isoform X2 [Carica papaya]
MALAHCLFAVPMETSKHAKASVLSSSSSSNDSLLSLSFASASPGSKASKLSVFHKPARLRKSDRNPYLSEGTRQAAATTAALAKKYGADITVVLIDEKQKESLPEHETLLSSIRWHLSEGGFQEFRLLERLGKENKPTAIIGEVADDLDLDLVVMSMEAIHSKHVDANLLAEFIPCPVLLLPL